MAGKTYVVTGASSGIGKGVALKLGDNGANIVLAARREDLLDEVATTIRQRGGTPLVVVTDVADAGQVENLAQRAVERFGRIDVWINSAGVGAMGRFEEIPIPDHSRLIDVNLKGVVYGSHAAVTQFKRQDSGVLVNIGSIESEVPLALHASYAATKAAVLSLGRALNEEIRMSPERGRIKVGTVLPWAIDTPFFEHTANYTGHNPRMALPDRPDKVVNAIIRFSLDPQEELAVGWKAKAAYASHRIAPDVSERFSAYVVRKEQLEMAGPTENTDGILRNAADEDSSIVGGLRERMAREDRQRKRDERRNAKRDENRADGSPDVSAR